MSDKQWALDVIRKIPDGASLEEITETLRCMAAISKGMESVERGDVVPHEEVEKMMAQWTVGSFGQPKPSTS